MSLQKQSHFLKYFLSGLTEGAGHNPLTPLRREKLFLFFDILKLFSCTYDPFWIDLAASFFILKLSFKIVSQLNYFQALKDSIKSFNVHLIAGSMS